MNAHRFPVLLTVALLVFWMISLAPMSFFDFFMTKTLLLLTDLLVVICPVWCSTNMLWCQFQHTSVFVPILFSTLVHKPLEYSAFTKFNWNFEFSKMWATSSESGLNTDYQSISWFWRGQKAYWMPPLSFNSLSKCHLLSTGWEEPSQWARESMSL